MLFQNIVRVLAGFAFVLSLQACTQFTDSPRVKSLRAKAEAGEFRGQYQMGILYTNGQGVAQDYAAAAAWFERSARLGHAPAQFMLGVAYASGRGVGVDDSAALKLFSAAARQGHARAQYQLANAVANGRGTEPDMAWAARWYGKSARQGHAAAMFSLGVSWAMGLGLPADPARAWAWLDLASSKGDKPAAPVRDKVAAAMSVRDLSKARALRGQWKEANDAPFADVPTVLYVQRGLGRLGLYAGLVDGVAGTLTEAAVGKYSGAAGLGGGGRIDENLVNSLRAALKTAK